MDVLDIFNFERKFERKTIPGGASQGYIKTDNLPLDDDVQTLAPSEAGTEYAVPYVEVEEKTLLETTKRGYNIPNYETAVCDLISQGTISNLNELYGTDSSKIYRSYNFAYRPKANLTITTMKDRIVSMIETTQVTVLQGPTGCGKTTQVPQFILNSHFDQKEHCNIVVTQPRRIAAISIAKRVCEERQWPVGTLVGYQVGMVNNTSEDTRLTYCTIGVLLNKLIKAKHMLDYTHVILDEVHERNQEMDFLMLVVRKLLRTNSRRVKVVLMSATFDVTKVSKYFSLPIGDKLEPAPVIDISKRSFFNVNVFYLCQMRQLGQLPEVRKNEPEVSNNMMEFCLRLIIILDGVDRQEEGGEEELRRSVILIFLPGIYEIEEMHNILTEPKHENFKWDVVVLHSSITNEEQQKIFEKPPTGYRRIILSTNIAESSITVPDVKYVIDFCLTKQLVTDPVTNFQCLELTWASRTNCKQRAGRTGRVMDGRVYRLVPKNFYETVMKEECDPEMLRAPLEKLVLQSKILNMGEPKAILALSLDPPDLTNLERTILLLKETGALVDTPDNTSHYDGELTDLGRVMASLPVDIYISKLIVLGHVYSVLREAIIIGASMAVKSMFSTPFKERSKAYNAKLTWAASSCSDCIAFLNAYRIWAHEKSLGHLSSNVLEKNWARRNFIQIKVLREVDALVQEMTQRLSSMGIREAAGENKVVWRDMQSHFVLKIVIAGAFYPNYFVRRLQGGQMNELSGIKLLGGLDPTNTVYLTGWPTNQPGPLYAQRLQKIFQECLNSPVGNVSVTFDGSSKVFVQFSRTQAGEQDSEVPKVPGKVDLAVYKAIKMRQNKFPITIPLLDHHTAIMRAKKLNLAPALSSLMIGTKQVAKESEKTFVTVPAEDSEESVPLLPETETNDPIFRPMLPGIVVNYIPLVISYMDNPSHFWAQTKKEETWTNLCRINTILNGPDRDVQKLSEQPPIGALVVAPFADNGTVKYYRAVVQSYSAGTEEPMAHVFYADYGNTAVMKLRELRTFKGTSNVQNIPGQAFECVLAHLQPSFLRNMKGQWAIAANNRFRQLVGGNIKLFGVIYSVVNSVVSLDLIRIDPKNPTPGERKININKCLIKEGFADHKQEDYLSRNNHDAREQHTEMSREQRMYHDEQQYNDVYAHQKYPPPPDESECGKQSVTLRGPNSPLEMEIVHLVGAGRDKRAHVEWNSVNSVLLDTDPQDTHERLLVAGSVGQNITGENLTLRNTTLMPNVHGLPALLSLIFAPTIELRMNSRGSRYIGAICGLGFDPNSETNASLFPEHDMEIPFDVEISIQDLQDINILRYWMNMSIHVGEENTAEKDANTLCCQNKIKDIMYKLITKKRQPQIPQMPVGARKWNLIDPALRLVVETGRSVQTKSNIYKFHCALDLEEENLQLEAITANLQELRALATENMHTKVPHNVVCKLCDKIILDIPALRMHLYSQEHRRREKEEGVNLVR